MLRPPPALCNPSFIAPCRPWGQLSCTNPTAPQTVLRDHEAKLIPRSLRSLRCFHCSKIQGTAGLRPIRSRKDMKRSMKRSSSTIFDQTQNLQKTSRCLNCELHHHVITRPGARSSSGGSGRAFKPWGIMASESKMHMGIWSPRNNDINSHQEIGALLLAGRHSCALLKTNSDA